MKIAIVGTGYVGLVTGTCLADTGNHVTCIDIDKKKVDLLKDGKVPFYEPGLDELVKKNVVEQRLFFTTSYDEAIPEADITFIAVNTPPRDDGHVNLDFVQNAARAIGKRLKRYQVIAMKSTAPVGTCELVRNIILQETSQNVDFDVISNPEFLKEGAAIDDFLRPNRVIIGLASERPLKLIKDLYIPFMRRGERFIVMDIRSTELTKYVANAMLATRISFMNEISNLCEKIGANIDYVRRGIGSDPRIGPDFLYPGLGYGGSCLPKDVKGLIQFGLENNQTLKILQAVHEINQRQPGRLIDKIINHFDGKDKLKGLQFTLWGLAFKAKTDDIREAPAQFIIQTLLDHDVRVQAFDPVAEENMKAVFAQVNYHDNAYNALVGSHALIIATEWNDFRNPDFQRMKNVMKSPVIFDGRNLYNVEKMREFNFSYYRFGYAS